jgi:nucleotide-binding universal stress UspA family protein
MKIGNILFPTDFSEASNSALAHASSLARKLDAQVTVLHVGVPNAADPGQPHLFCLNEDGYTNYVEEQLREIVVRIGPDLNVSTFVSSEVSPALGILNYLERYSIDAVVMGTYGRSALGRFFLGTVAEKVVRHARCPLLTVALHRQNYQNTWSYRRILAPCDFSEYSLEAVRFARALARKYQADLQVLYVITSQPEPGFCEEWTPDINDFLPQVAASAKESLAETLDEQGLDDLRVAVEIGRAGNRASEEIVSFAEEHHSDLIVMGTHGMTGIERVMLGSTTERVVRTAPCPVLTVQKSEE